MDEFLCETICSNIFVSAPCRLDDRKIENRGDVPAESPGTRISEAKRAVKRSLESTGHGIYDRIGS